MATYSCLKTVRKYYRQVESDTLYSEQSVLPKMTANQTSEGNITSNMNDPWILWSESDYAYHPWYLGVNPGYNKITLTSPLPAGRYRLSLNVRLHPIGASRVNDHKITFFHADNTSVDVWTNTGYTTTDTETGIDIATDKPTVAIEYRYTYSTTGKDGGEEYVRLLKLCPPKQITNEASANTPYDFYRDADQSYTAIHPIRTYYKYAWEPWKQPVFTSNTAPDGSIATASGFYSSSSEDASPFRAMDGIKSGTSLYSFWSTTGTTGWWQIKFPYKIALSGLVYYDRYTYDTNPPKCGRFYANTEATIPIGEEFTSSANWNSVIIYNNATPIITDTLYYKHTSGNVLAIGELDITATRQIAIKSTPDDYDFYRDIDQPYTAIHPIRKYYKKVSEPWTQPVLTGNTSYGIVSGTSVNPDNPVWHALNGIKTGQDKYLSLVTSGGNISWELPVAIHINSFLTCQTQETGYLGRFPKTIRLSASQDGSTWTEIGYSEGYVQPASGAYITTTCTSTEHYQYLKFEYGATVGSGSGANAGIAVSEIVINADISNTIESTADNYDFYRDI